MKRFHSCFLNFIVVGLFGWGYLKRNIQYCNNEKKLSFGKKLRLSFGKKGTIFCTIYWQYAFVKLEKCELEDALES